MSPNLILVIWGILATIFIVSSNALHFPSNALSLDKTENKIKIELIDVKCDKNENGMHVNVVFSQPFDGIIYSQGYFSDPKCRYVMAGENENSYNFVVPFEGCGSKRSCSICDSIDNILVIQLDEEVQGEFDAARKISCSRTGIEEEKKIFFKPFIVEMLDVVMVPTAHGGVDCWMDIQRGIYPQLTAIGNSIKIGESLSVLVYLRDPKKEYDLTVRNCWAYDSEDFDDKKTGKVRLSDSHGCSVKRKLLGSWKKTTQTGSSGASLLLHNTLRAFKFPDESQVYLKCDIEICRGTCAEAICDADEINKVDCTVDPFNSKCMHDRFNTEHSVESTTLPLNFKPYTTRAPNTFEKQKSTKRPLFTAAPTERFAYISTTTVIDQETTTHTPFVCGPGSRDIRCRRPQNFETTTHIPETTTTTFRETTFRDTTTHPNYIQSNTIKPVVDTFCDRYPNSKRCSQRITESLGPNIEILTFKPPSPFATVKYQTTTDVPTTTILPTTTYIPNVSVNCARNPNDYRCKQNEIIQTTIAPHVDEKPFNCKGNKLDPRCPNPTPTNTPPTYLPPKTTQKVSSLRTDTPTSTTIRTTKKSTTTRQPIARQQITRQPITRQPVTKQSITKKPTKKFFICVPGSNDVNCDYEEKKEDHEPKEKVPAIPSRNQYATKKPNCFVGSTNPECQRVSTDTVTSKPKLSTYKPPQAFTPRTPAPRISPCYPGSLDPKCTKLTTKKPVFKPISTTNKYVASEIPVFVIQEQPNCYPGSPDPACSTGPSTKKTIPKITASKTTTRPVTPTTQKTIYKAPSTTRAPTCYPGSPDQRCLQLITTKRVYPTISTTQESTTEIPSTTTFVPGPTIKTQCSFGSKNPKCAKLVTTTDTTDVEITTTSTYIPETTTYKTIKTYTKIPSTRCYPGSLDPQCKPNTKKPTFTPFKTESTKSPVITTVKQTSTERLIPKGTTAAPRCYIGSTDSRCQQTTKKPLTAIPQVPPKFSITTNVQPTRPPVCYPGALDVRCRQSTTTTTTTTVRPPASFPSRQELSKTTAFTTLKPIPSIAKTAPQLTTKKPVFKPISTTNKYVASEIPVFVIQKQPTFIPFKTESQVTTKSPVITTVKQTSTERLISKGTTAAPRVQQTTKKPLTAIPQVPPKFSITTNVQPTRPPVCYPGALDVRCRQSTTTTTTTTTTTESIPQVDLRHDIDEIESSSTQKPAQCYPGDSKCRQSITTTTPKSVTSFISREELYATETPSTPKPISIISTAAPQRPPSTTLISKIATTTPSIPKSGPTCYPGSLDTRCKSAPLYGQLKCGPGIPLNRLDPRCPNPTPTAEPATYLPPLIEKTTKPPIFTTKSPIVTTKSPIVTSTGASQIVCSPNSLDPRCRTTSTIKPTTRTPYTKGTTTTKYTPPKITTKSPFIPVVTTTKQPPIRFSTLSTTKAPTYTTSAFSTTTRRPFTTFTTRRIFSSPQPFVTRPSTVGPTTENVLCYPGSPIEGCKPTDVVTPSYCYPGSKDKRCPQLPPSFSTREPATYLPPFPDSKSNRVKRSAIPNQEPSEIVKFSLSFKPFRFS